MIVRKDLSKTACPMTLAAGAKPCIGAACMAWRDIVANSGYCGLAGLPVLTTAPADQSQDAYLSILSGSADSAK
jgi:hypothetical protein